MWLSTGITCFLSALVAMQLDGLSNSCCVAQAILVEWGEHLTSGRPPDQRAQPIKVQRSSTMLTLDFFLVADTMNGANSPTTTFAQPCSVHIVSRSFAGTG